MFKWYTPQCKASTAGFTFHSYTLRWERRFNLIWTYPTIKGVF